MMLLQELDQRYAVEREFASVSCAKTDWSMKAFCVAQME